MDYQLISSLLNDAHRIYHDMALIKVPQHVVYPFYTLLSYFDHDHRSKMKGFGFNELHLRFRFSVMPSFKIRSSDPTVQCTICAQNPAAYISWNCEHLYCGGCLAVWLDARVQERESFHVEWRGSKLSSEEKYVKWLAMHPSWYLLASKYLTGRCIKCNAVMAFELLSPIGGNQTIGSVGNNGEQE